MRFGPTSRSRRAGPSRRIALSELALPCLLFLFVLFGGGGAEGPVHNGVIEAAAAIGLLWFLAAHFAGRRVLGGHAAIPVLLTAALLLLMAAQLVPLPAFVWNELPGREAARAALQLVGAENGWRALSLDPERTRLTAAGLLTPAAILVGALGAGRRELIFCVAALVCAAAVSAIIGAVQLAADYPSWTRYFDGPNPGSASGVFANPNHHAALLLSAIVATAVLIRALPAQASSRRSRIRPLHFLWCVVPFLAVVAIATQSRAGAGMLALALGSALALATRKRALLALWGIGAAIVVALTAAIIFSPPEALLPFREDVLFAGDFRLALLPDLLFTTGQFWPLGAGFGTFQWAFAANQSLDTVSNTVVNHAHNDVLEFILETGVPGLLLLGLGGAAIGWRMAAAARRPEGEPAGMVRIWGGALIIVTLIGLSLFDYPLRTDSVATAAGLALALVFWRPPADRATNAQARGTLPILLCLLVGIGIGAQVLRMRLAEDAVRRQDPVAASLRPQSGQALAVAANQALRAGQPRQAHALAARAIAHSPMSSLAVRIFAMTGSPAQAAGGWQLAAALGWKDPVTQLWAMQQALQNQEYDIAAMRADAMLRSYAPEEMLSVVRLASADPGFRTALLPRLRLRPAWRLPFLQVPATARPPQQLVGITETLTALARSGDRPSRAEASYALRILIDKGEYERAWQVYQLIVPRRELGANLLEDGSFERPVEAYLTDSTPFDWTLVQPEGLTISRPEGSAGGLRLQTSGAAAGTPVRQIMMITPGRYRLQFSLTGDDEAEQAFQFVVACADSGIPLTAAAGAIPAQAAASASRTVAFDVPASCRAISLNVNLAATGMPAEAAFGALTMVRE